MPVTQRLSSRITILLGVLVLQAIEESSQKVLSNLLAADERMSFLTPSSLESRFDQPSVTLKQ